MEFLKERSGWIILVLCLLVAGYIFNSRKHQVDHDGEKLPEALEVGPKQEARFESGPSTASTRPSTEIRREYNAMMASGLREIPTVLSNNLLKFKFKPTPTPLRCSLGEYDLLKGMVKSLSQPLFLLTIEPLSGGGEPAFRRRLALGDFSTKVSHEAVLPYSIKAKDYGVYMCIDPGSSNDCGKKQTLGPREWNEAMNRPSNRTFYFQALSIKNGRVFLLPANNWEKDNLKRMKDSLSPVLESKSTIETLHSYLNKLSPIPARVQKDVLELPVSFRDPSC